MISVCLASLNGAKYIEVQIKSIINQLSSNDEIIIIDSGSTDDTLHIIKSFNDSRIKLYHFDSSAIGGGEFKIINKIRCAFLYGIMRTNGDTVYLSDQDDIWKPNKISLCECALKKYDVVCHNCDIIDDNLTIQAVYKRKHISYAYNFINPPFQGCCMAFTKKIVSQIKSCQHILNTTELSHDHLIGFLSMIFNGKKSITIIDQSLIWYRRHSQNVSSTGGKSNHSLYFKIRYRINEIYVYLRLLNKKLRNYHKHNLK